MSMPVDRTAPSLLIGPGTPALDELVLTDEEARVVAATASKLADQFTGGTAPVPFDLARALAGQLPERVRAILGKPGGLGERHAVVVRGNLVNDEALGATPTHWKQAETAQSSVHGCALLLYASLLGDVIGWQSQQDGRIVTDVVPSPGYEDSLVSSSSRVELNWHTEDAFSSFRSDLVGLYCLRAAKGGATTVSYAGRDQLSPQTVRVLAEPRFHIRADDAHEAATTSAAHVPLVEAATDPFSIRVDRDFTDAADGDAEAAAAMRELYALIDANVYDLPLEAGDVAFLNNRVVVHGRRSFEPRFDGTDRWLKRVNVVADLGRVATGLLEPGGRVIAN